jgi:hypothetical protein
MELSSGAIRLNSSILRERMALSQSGILDVRVVVDGPDLFVTWVSNVPKGTIFQVYVDRRLAWYGASNRCYVPIPAGDLGRNVWVEIGTVDPDEPTVNYSSSLVAPGGRSERALLSWTGGTYLDPTGQDDIRGFQIYQSLSPGLPVDPTTSVDSVAAYPGGWINDGFGKGEFGGGGFGRAATLYSWWSGPLASGVWQFAVLPFDKAGNVCGSVSSATVTINAAPLPPAMNASQARIASTYAGPSNPQLTLNWLPSPSE